LLKSNNNIINLKTLSRLTFHSSRPEAEDLGVPRPKDETEEEKKNRKKAVKEQRRVC
jgi:hypothetical protein